MSLHIWHLCSNRWNSAITEYALSAARALQGAGHRCLFLPLAHSPAAMRSTGLLTTVPIKSFSVQSLPFLLDKARIDRPDVILTYGGPEMVLALAIKAASRAKVVRFRGQAVDAFGPVYRARQWLAHSGIDMVLAPSITIEAEVRRLRLPAPVVCVPLGVDQKVFKRPAAPPPDALDARGELLIFGRFDPIKGHAAMVGLMPLILARWGERPGAPRLHIAGEEANLTVSDLSRLVEQQSLRLGEDVKITAGRMADVPSALSRVALGVVPSLGSEVICRVAEEFLMCGTPVAVSGAGSLEDVLFPGAGFSYRGQSPEVAAIQFVEWMGISRTEGEFAKAARGAVAAGLYSLTAMAKNLDAALQLL